MSLPTTVSQALEITRVPTAPAQSSSFLERHKLPAEVAGLEGRLTISGQIGHLVNW